MEKYLENFRRYIVIKNEVNTKLTHISDKKYNISVEVPSDIVDETFKSFLL